ncbi:FAD-dependent oxidoreductase [Pigmentibacter ruber]
MKKIIIVGGGLAGSLTAIYLAKRGLEVHVFEKRGNPFLDFSDYVDQVSSRAIGVTMSIRGIKAVLNAGIPKEELDLCGIPITGMSFYIAGSFKTRKLLPPDHLSPLSLSRADFQKLLNKYATIHNVYFHYGHRCLDVDLDEKTITTKDNNGQINEHSGDLIIGADGARSCVRQAMQNNCRRFEYQQSFFKHGYKTLVISEGSKLNLNKDLLYFFGMSSGGLFAGRAATIPDGSISFAVCLPYQGEISLQTKDKAIMNRFFDKYYCMLPSEVRKEMLLQFIEKPSNDLINVNSSVFYYKKNALILGDSAHATAPFLGQGMNMALEDAYILDSLFEKYNCEFETILPEFNLLRKLEADAMQYMAINNYEVLSRSNPIYFLRTKYIRYMAKNFPTFYPPDMAEKLYFTSMPYSELRNIQKKQNVWYKFGRVN